MRLGVAWYPEQRPPGEWADDLVRMRDAGLSLVRIAEFSWSSLEPSRGRLCWDWLDNAILLADRAGVDVVLGTPTAVPPVWLCIEQPSIMSVGPDGVPRSYGGRKFTCPTSSAFLGECDRLVNALVERYGSHERVVAWQLDNEPGNQGSAFCWCPECDTAFRAWLVDRYGSIEELNRRWGTAVWSGAYPSFDAIRLPRATIAEHSPSLLLAHHRFASSQVISAIHRQRQIVEGAAKRRPILSNVPADEAVVDARALATSLGAAAIDHYPTAQGGLDDNGLFLDTARGHTGRFWVMEQQPGPINWTASRSAVAPGQVRVWGWRAALHGAEAMLFFSWRPASSGAEQYHSGLLRHDGSASRALLEVRRLASELREVGPDQLVRGRSPVAVLWSAEDQWAFNLDPHQCGLTYRAVVGAAYAAARRLGLEVDVVAPDADLTPYRAILAPALHLSSDRKVAALETALAAGRLVILGARSLVKDEDNCWIGDRIPAGLSGRLDGWVVDGIATDGDVVVEPFGVPSGPWIDLLEASACDTVARYAGPAYANGSPAVLQRDNLVLAGFTSSDAWLALLQAVLPDDLTSALLGPDLERFTRSDRTITIDHGALAVDGIAFQGGHGSAGMSMGASNGPQG